jgi:glycosyltransferase involved in cell wall biosynthesis
VRSARFTIVGSRPTAQVRALAKAPGVTVTGFVEDTREHLRRAAISVAPLRIARGIQNKVLEALAMGLPVVGTRSATQGIEGVAGEHYLVRESARELADAIVGLLADPTEARALGARGRRLVEERYDWEATLAPLDRLCARFEPAAHP